MGLFDCSTLVRIYVIIAADRVIKMLCLMHMNERKRPIISEYMLRVNLSRRRSWNNPKEIQAKQTTTTFN